jgi:hypothetical protein
LLPGYFPVFVVRELASGEKRFHSKVAYPSNIDFGEGEEEEDELVSKLHMTCSFGSDKSRFELEEEHGRWHTQRY